MATLGYCGKVADRPRRAAPRDGGLPPHIAGKHTDPVRNVAVQQVVCSSSLGTLQYSTVLSMLTGGIDGSSAHVHHFTVRCARRASCFAAAPRHLMLHARCALYVACQLDAVRAALLATSSRPHDALGRPGRACLLQPHLIGHYVYGVRVCARVWRGRGDS